MKLNRRERLVFWVIITYALIAGCAHVQIDTPQFAACKDACSSQGYPNASVLETDEAIDCECHKPIAAPEGT